MVIQTRGSGVVAVGGEQVALRFGGSCFLSAASPGLAFTPGAAGGEIILCRPSAAASRG